MFILIWNSMKYFFYSKSSSRLFSESKIFHITAPFIKCIMWQWGNITVNTHCDVIIGRRCCYWYQTVMWLIARIFHTRSRKSGSFTQDLTGRRMMIFQLKKLNVATHHRIQVAASYFKLLKRNMFLENHALSTI